MCYRVKKTALFLITGLAINVASAQTVRKVGDNPSTLNKDAVLEVESITKGFLPPRMKMSERTAIDNPAKGLVVWCTDCNLSTVPPSGQLCTYSGSVWTPLTMNTSFNVTTNTATINNANVASVAGTFVSGDQPTETGVVYREITGNDFQTLPVLNVFGNVAAPTYKAATGSVVTKAGDPISLNTISLTSVTDGKRPWYFRTYAWSPFGISYGKALIYNVAKPAFTIKTPVFSNGDTMNPVFAGTLTVNAGTPPNTITEYGYYSGTTAATTTNKVVLSATPAGTATLAALNATLSSKGFTADPVTDLAVNDYKVNVTAPAPLVTTYFRYYVVANGTTCYSDEVSFTPVDPITGGSAIAALGKIEPPEPFTIGKPSTSKSVFKVHFNVTSPGTYAGFELKTIEGKKIRGNTTGLGMADTPVPAGNFITAGDNVLTFPVTGTPYDSLDGNLFAISRITTTLSTGAIQPDPVTGGTAVATATIENSPLSPSLKIGESSLPGTSFKVNFNVTHAGSYAKFTSTKSGDTKGVSMSPDSVPAGNFAVGNSSFTFTVTGTPYASLDGNTFAVSRIGNLNTGLIEKTPAKFADVTVGPMQGGPFKIGATPPLSVTFKVDFNVTKAGTYNFVPKTPPTGATTGLSMDSKNGIYLNTGPQWLTFTVSGTPVTSSEGNTFNILELGDFNTGEITKRTIVAGNIKIPSFEVGNTKTANVFEYLKIDEERTDTSNVNITQVEVSPANSKLRVTSAGLVEAGYGINTLGIGSYSLKYSVTDKKDSRNPAVEGTVNVTVIPKKIEVFKKDSSKPDTKIQTGNIATVNILKNITIGEQKLPATIDNVELEQIYSDDSVALGIVTNNSTPGFNFGDVFCGFDSYNGGQARKLLTGTYTLRYRVIDKTYRSNSVEATFTVEVR